MSDWAAVALFMAVGIIFGAGGLLTSYLIQPRSKNRYKGETYECGLPTEGASWVQFKNQYFTYALMFVIFDVEVIFLYPWAVSFTNLGLAGLIKMFIFIFILVLGLWYAWKEGALEWR
ncbi:NADH-quinone oxidoreductase subunit A [Desulforamulus hydrothermalis Lam5 = DSM 18033]|uniref:NADH-quinone oxidoreductase subunit A n=1 Tax=Desulforamulus hydrothermalis Lam5 = DSM 18033 TaxID=1121428 RepID=K8DZN1_9FIRM|nr:NADH-quinone oxidoreductase subunit A [Desulforamulus hydrothermalis Lam5 = DSM 18033]SHH29100.1 NADH dehydrogenase subunit A [Desulforamulus hydrothermalis Lam5 = DSM 18033]